jgi:vacuolar-type H+-ATPase subunit I/STV1
MDFKEALAAVKAGTGTEEHFAAIEKLYYDASSAVNGQKTRADNFAAIAEKYSSVEKALVDFGIDTKVDISEQLKKMKAPGTSQNDEMTRTMNQLREKLDMIEREKKETDEALSREAAKNHFSATFNDSKFVGGDAHLKLLMYEGVIGVDKDRKPFVKIDDTFLPADDSAIEKILEKYPSIKSSRKTQQNPGGGTNNNGGGSNTSSKEDFIKSYLKNPLA